MRWMAKRSGWPLPPMMSQFEIAKRGKLINHRIDPDVDLERDFIGANLLRTDALAQQSYLAGADPVFRRVATAIETLGYLHGPSPPKERTRR